MSKRTCLFSLVCVVLSAFLLFGCDSGSNNNETIKEVEVDLTDLSVDVDVTIEIIDTVTLELVVAVEGIPGQLNVVTFVDPGCKKVDVKVSVFDRASGGLLLTKETFRLDISVDLICKLIVDVDKDFGGGASLGFSLDCPILPDVDVDVDVDIPVPGGCN